MVDKYQKMLSNTVYNKLEHRIDKMLAVSHIYYCELLKKNFAFPFTCPFHSQF